MTEDIKKTIGNNIKKYRKIRNETATELAEAIEVSQSTISDWENGKKMPRAGAIEKMAIHWNISKSKILNDDSTINSHTSNNIDILAAHIDDDVSDEDMAKIIEFIELVNNQK